MTRFVYVDNSNLWIEGQRVAAVRSGLCRSMRDAQIHDILDNTWKYDFGRLFRLVCPPGEDIGRAALFGSTPPPNDTLWQIAKSQGFEVSTFPRNAANREKKVDNQISVSILEDSYQEMQSGDFTVLVSGDGDFVPTIESLQGRGFRVRNAFWAHGSRELREIADDYYQLDQHFDLLSR